MSKVKCLYCEEMFNKDKEPFEKIGRRYAHKDCYLKYHTEDEDYKEKIYSYIKELYGKDYNYSVIERQRKQFIKDDNLTNKDIYLALKYHYEVQKGNVSRSKGRIGIVPYVVDEARKYYNDLERRNKQISNVSIEYQQKVVNFSGATSKTKNKFINMNDLE